MQIGPNGEVSVISRAKLLHYSQTGENPKTSTQTTGLLKGSTHPSQNPLEQVVTRTFNAI